MPFLFFLAHGIVHPGSKLRTASVSRSLSPAESTKPTPKATCATRRRMLQFELPVGRLAFARLGGRHVARFPIA